MTDRGGQPGTVMNPGYDRGNDVSTARSEPDRSRPGFFARRRESKRQSMLRQLDRLDRAATIPKDVSRPKRSLHEVIERTIEHGIVLENAEYAVELERIRRGGSLADTIYPKTPPEKARYGRDLEDQKKRDESSLEALGFKSMDWRLAEKGNNLAAAWEGVRSCQNTLALMSEFAAPPPDQPDVPKAYGTLDFPTSIGQAPYMLLHSSKFQGGPACLPLVQLLIEYLGLKPPRLIVSCIGAETENQIDIIQKVKKILKFGLTEMEDVWFITAGFGDGLSQIVAKLISDFRKTIGADSGTLPVIGIMPWDAVPRKTRAELRTGHPFRINYMPAETGFADSADLDASHTHFLFVQSPPGSNMGDVGAAFRLRKDLQDALTEEVLYFEHVKQWRVRSVVKSAFAKFKVLNVSSVRVDGTRKGTTSATWKVSIRLAATRFSLSDGGGGFPPWVCQIVRAARPGEPELRFGVEAVRVSVVPGNSLFFEHTGSYLNTGAAALPDNGLRRGDEVTLEYDPAKFLDPAIRAIKGLEVHERIEKTSHTRSWCCGALSRIEEEQGGNFALSYMDDTNQFDHFLEHTTKICTVTLVVGGSGTQDDGSIRGAELAILNVDAVSPLVVFDGSGGFANVLAFAWNLLHDQSAQSNRLDRNELDMMVRKTFNIFNPTAATALMTRILNIVAVSNKVSIFGVDNSDGEDLDRAILGALFKNGRPDYLADIAVMTEPSEITLVPDEEIANIAKYSWADRQRYVQRYELHLNNLRFAMSLDRVEEMEEELSKASEAWDQMEAVWSGFADANPDRKYNGRTLGLGQNSSPMTAIALADWDLPDRLKWWYQRSKEQESRSAGYENRLLLSYKDQIELALEWALDSNKLAQVQLLKPLIDDFPVFVYGPKRCRMHEGYGTTLAELYEYEKHADIRYFLEPLLRFRKDPPTFDGREKTGSIPGFPGGNIREVNDVRTRRVWTLVRKLMYGEVRDVEIDENNVFEEGGYAVSSRRAFKTKGRQLVPMKFDCYGNLNSPTEIEPYPGDPSVNWEKKQVVTVAVQNPANPSGPPRKRIVPKKRKLINVAKDRTLESVYRLVLAKRDPTSELYNPEHAELLANQELLIWAVLTNRFDLAVYFWQEGGQAIPNALIASKLFEGMANSDELQKRGRLADRINIVRDYSKRFEDFAIGVMSVCYSKHPDMTQDVLGAQLTPYDWLRRQDGEFDNAMQIAKNAGNMDFINHAASQAMIDRQWRGGLEHTLKQTADGTLIKEKGTCPPFMVITSPRVKYLLALVFYGALLILFSFFVLTPLSEDVGILELVLAGWFGVLLLEEVRQLFKDGVAWQYIVEWWSDVWNKLDFVMYTTFFVTFCLRCLAVATSLNEFEDFFGTEGMRDLFRGLYSLVLIIVYLRLFQFFQASASLGPRVVILGELLSTLLQYSLMLAVFIMSYGIFLQTVLNPDREITLRTVGMIIYRPYFQMYGELMLEDTQAETTCVGSESAFTDCSSIWEWFFLPVMTGLYLVVTSLMIFNMLIADFTMTFEDIKEESEKVYRMGMYDLLEEYQERPFFPPPLSAFELLYRALKSFFEGAAYVTGLGDEMQVELITADEQDFIRVTEDFQDRCCDTFLENLEFEEKMSLEGRIARIETGVVDAKKDLEHFKGRAYSSARRNERKVVNTRKAKYVVREDKMVNAPTLVEAAAVPWVSEQIKTGKFDLKLEDDRVGEFAELYGDNPSIAGPSAENPKWSASWPANLKILRGPEFLSRCSLFQPIARDAERQMEGASDNRNKRPTMLDLNLDSLHARLTVTGSPGPMPRGLLPHANPLPNPFRPTDEPDLYNVWEGYKSQNRRVPSREALPQLGCNYYKLHIVTRWKRDDRGMMIERGGKHVLEFVAMKRHTDDHMWAIPDLHYQDYGNAEYVPTSPVYKYALHSKNFRGDVPLQSKSSIEQEVRAFLGFDIPGTGPQPREDDKLVYPYQGLKIYEGFLDDERNTANTWVMADVMIHHDHDNILDAYTLLTTYGDEINNETAPPAEMAWLTIHSDFDLVGEQEDLLRHVAALHDAYW